MATVTISEVRVFCDMATDTPADTTITQWITDNKAIINQSFPDVEDTISNIVIKNRISVLYKNTRNDGISNSIQQATLAQFMGLTMDECLLLGGNVTNVDAISMNGKRRSETYLGRR